MVASRNLAARLQQVVPRMRRFLEAEEPGHLVIVCHLPGDCHTPLPPYNTVDFKDPEAFKAFHETSLENAKTDWRAKEGLDDDSLPCICPKYGYAEHVAWTGAPIKMQPSTSMTVPIIHCDEDIPSLRLDPDSMGVRLMRDGYAYLRSRQDGSFLLSMRGCSSPMELANALRGDDLFMDFLEEPEFCHALLQRIVAIYPAWLEMLRGWADENEGGHTFMYGGTWLGPNAMGHFSNDAAMLCGADIYEEFGFPYEAPLLSRYRHNLFHVHAEKIHYLPQLARLPNLRLLQIQDDPSTPTNFRMLEEIFTHTAEANLFLTGSAEELRSVLPELTRRNCLLQVFCRDREEAEETIARVRKVSRPLA